MADDISKNNDVLKGQNGLLLTLIFFVILAFWTLFFLFVIPEIQKKYFITAPSGILEFQSGYGFFTISGYFCFVLLAVTLLAVLIIPSYKNTKGVWIFISILLIFSILAIAESLCAYSYIKEDGVVIRNFISTGEKHFNWGDVKNIEISFYNTSTKPKGLKGESMMKVVIIFDRSNEIVLRESASGDSPILMAVFSNIKDSTPFEIDEHDKAEWETVRKFYKKLNCYSSM